MDLKETVATNVRRFRNARGLTQEELAHRAGVSGRYLGSVERASASPSVTVLGHLAAALGVPAAELVSEQPREALRGSPLR
jgi:transcriptional regulator with XRE-family HTH domain